MAPSTGYLVADIAALKAIGSSDRTDGYTLAVASKRDWYQFNAASSLTGDDDLVVTPSSGSGRWFSMGRYPAPVLFGTASPVGSVTPNFKGQQYCNTTTGILYLATGTSSGDWKIVATLSDPPSSTLNTGVISAWTFENTIADQVGSNNLSTSGTAAYTPGFSGQGYSFTGSNALTIADNSSLRVINNDGTGALNTDFTIATFTNCSDSQDLIKKPASGGGSEYKITFQSGESKYVDFVVRSSSVSAFSIGNSSSGYFILGSFELSTRIIRIYVKNLQTGAIVQANTTVPNFGLGNPGTLTIGGGSGYWIDGIVFYKRLLTSDEIIELSGKQYPF